LSGLENLGSPNGAVPGGNAPNGPGANGAAANSPVNSGGIDNGAIGSAGIGGNGLAGPENAAGTGVYRIPDHGGNGFPAAMPAGYDPGSARGQSQQLYGPPSQAMLPGQPGTPDQDHHAREAYARQYQGRPSFQQYPAQPPLPGHPPGQPAQPAPAVPAVRAAQPGQPGAISLPDAVKAAHSEGYSFGESVGRDAPGLWLEAVLARKPRMPSDLEARLLQGSVLPIDSLLHDEVRHSLRRGFWDALESTRR